MNDRPREFSASDEAAPPVPDFDLIREIGQGGFGRVWLAANRTTGRLRAVKVIPLRGSGPANPAGREITSITRLEANVGRHHPHLLTIHHVGTTAEHLFYAMDLADDVAGGPGSSDPNYRPASLQSRLESGPLAPEECLRHARALLAGLAFLHESGMIHRDVKPANCLLVDGELKLADFGLLTEAGPQVSRVGTRAYMPPDGQMDAKADVYAAGLVIYEMVTGLPAESFPRPGQHAGRLVRDRVLDALMRLALRACEPDPSQRFPDARRMLVELERLASPTAARRSRPARRVAAALGGLALTAAIVAAGLWATRPPRVHVNFVTHPFEATVWLDDTLQQDADDKPYRTPCTIDNLPARVHRVVFRRDGYKDLVVGPKDFAKARRIEYRLDVEP